MAKENCIKNLLDKKTEDAKVGEFLNLAQVKLEDLAKCVGPEEQAYRDKRPEFIATWTAQEQRVCDLQNQITTCYPNWKEYLEDPICSEVIDHVNDLKEKIRRNIGRPEKKLDYANEVFNMASQQLDSWKTITKWIKARLDANAALIEEICKLDSCKERKDRLCLIYIFFFELLPAHKQLEKPLDDLPEEHRDPEGKWCDECGHDDDKPRIKLCGFPWLIEPNQYDCKLADVWKIWSEVGVAQVKAQCDFDQVAAWRAELSIAQDPAQMRKNACAALRDHEEKNPDCNPKTQSTSD